MKDILLTSSALILALLALRRVFRRRISRRLQYALWGLVLLRLLLPVSLPAADFSVLSVSQPARAQVEERLEPVYLLPVAVERSPETAARYDPGEELRQSAAGHTVVAENGRDVVRYALTLEEALDLTWKAGMAVMAAYLLWSNLRFWRKLRKGRIPLELPESPYRTYLVEEALASPCLFGLLRPAVYLTPAAMASEDSLRHVLAHEETHARQGDPLWALLRGVCLAVYWFDPLVWWAAAASREDCELACDEGALKRLGEGERIPYGQTLLRLIPVRRSGEGILLAATTMASDKKRLAERITRIAENRKMRKAALCAVLTAAAAVCVVTFTGCVPQGTPASPGAAAESGEPQAPPETDAGGTLPAGEPVLTIPLAGLAPYEPVQPAQIPYPGSHGARHGHGHEAEASHHSQTLSEQCVLSSWYSGDTTYLSLCPAGQEATPEDCFLSFSGQEYTAQPFSGLFGRDGVVVSYYGEVLPDYYGTFNDYYVFDGSGQVSLLARVYGEPCTVDLDGDGELELAATDGWRMAQVIFRRDGQLYEADLAALLAESWPEFGMDLCIWEPEARCLILRGLLRDAPVYARRRVCFDGERLLLYPEIQGTENHLAAGVHGPEAVEEAARAAARADYEAFSAYYGDPERITLDGWEPPVLDGYRVTRLEYVDVAGTGPFPEGLGAAVYLFTDEIHTTTPERIVWAGGIYVDEEGWVGGFHDEGSPYLLFRILEDGSYVQVDSQIPGDVSPGSPVFSGELALSLMAGGALSPEEAPAQALYYAFYRDTARFTQLLSGYPEKVQDAALEKLAGYGAEPSDPEMDAELLTEVLNSAGSGGTPLSQGQQAVLNQLIGIIAAQQG